MKTPHDILDTLGALSQHDRDWIVCRLSPAARKSLLDGSMKQVAVPAINDAVAQSTAQPADPRVAVLRAATAEQVADVLRNEPAWVAHCVLSMDLPCEAELRFKLAGDLRLRIEQLQAEAVEYPKPIQDRVRNALCAALEQLPVGAVPTASRTLWSRIAASWSARRLRMSA